MNNTGNNQPEKVMPKYDQYGMTQWFWRVSHRRNFVLGNNTQIGSFTMIDAQNGVQIEDDVKIGYGCTILSYSSIDGRHGRVILRKGCNLGANSVVQPGVEIGEGSTIGANSLVNNNIPPGELWTGSPARFKKKMD
jgi:UDP-2-acetamido-3-amino-2,3-dideoxy-glucuronate N-acetyltransferase